jgi:hypothetical protein
MIKSSRLSLNKQFSGRADLSVICVSAKHELGDENEREDCVERGGDLLLDEG